MRKKHEKESILSPKIDVEYVESADIVDDVSQIIEQSQHAAFWAIDLLLLRRNWLIGKRIHEEELKEPRKNGYNLYIIQKLSKVLKEKHGKGFTKTNLYNYFRFYTLYKNIFHTACGQSLLSWSHYRILIYIEDDKARCWYEKEASENRWSVRTLQRNIETQYYYRLISSPNKEQIIKEMKGKTNDNEMLRTLEHIKNPSILEFLCLSKNDELYESAIETAIINNLQKFLIELGKGYAFVGRQYRIHTENSDYYVDLVFYNFILKCFVLIDLKCGKITHQDVGQMDMYVRMFDELIKGESDGPTLGIVLCSETDQDIARYSILAGNEKLFASKYMLYLPSEEQLKAEIEHQKTILALANKKEDY